MKIFLRGLFTTIMVICIFLLSSCIYLKQVMNKEIIGQIGKQTFTEEFSNSIMSQLPEVSDEKEQEIKTMLENNRDLNAMIDKISDRIMIDLSKTEIENINIDEDFKNFLKENKSLIIEIVEKDTGETIDEEKIDQAIDEAMAENDFNQVYQQTIEDTKKNIDSDTKIMLDGYNAITSQKFFTILGILLILSTCFTFLLQKPHYKGIVNISIATIVAAVLTTITAFLLNWILTMVISEMDFNITIHSTQIWITVSCLFVIGIVLLIINNIVSKKKKQKTV